MVVLPKTNKRKGLFTSTNEYYTPKELLELFESGKCFYCDESDSSKLGLDRIEVVFILSKNDRTKGSIETTTKSKK